jgi:hypothetical protein
MQDMLNAGRDVQSSPGVCGCDFLLGGGPHVVVHHCSSASRGSLVTVVPLVGSLWPCQSVNM